MCRRRSCGIYSDNCSIGLGTITYQWQSSTTGCGSGFTDIAGANGATYDASTIAVTTYYRRVVTSTLNGVPCSVNGNCITVTVNTITPGAVTGDQTHVIAEPVRILLPSPQQLLPPVREPSHYQWQAAQQIVQRIY
jgi:hypothetical protein